MKKILFVFAAGCVLAACNSSSTGNNQDSVDSAQHVNDSVSSNSATVSTNDNTSDFATEAASGGLMEVQAGQMAQQKAQSKRVKNFGMMMVRDHTKANSELKTLAAQQNITLPATLSDEHQKHIDDLSKKTGSDFDKAYMDMMVDDHKDDVSKFKDAAQNVKDSSIKNFAAKSVPILQMHLDSAQAIQQALK